LTKLLTNFQNSLTVRISK